MIGNAAGGLPPEKAKEMRDTFSSAPAGSGGGGGGEGGRCVILPSYGMTECMPISSPPLTYNLERTGTSGARGANARAHSPTSLMHYRIRVPEG